MTYHFAELILVAENAPYITETDGFCPLHLFMVPGEWFTLEQDQLSRHTVTYGQTCKSLSARNGKYDGTV